MKHPIYSDETLEFIKRAIECVQKGDIDQAQRIVDFGVNSAQKEMKAQGISGGSGNETANMIMLQVTVASQVASSGLVYIDASNDKWYSDLSKKVISAIKLENFKMPFTSGAISVNKRDYLFLNDDQGLVVIMLHDKELASVARGWDDFDEAAKILEVDTGFPYVILKRENKTIGELVSEANAFAGPVKKGQEQEFFAVMSALMYVSMANSSRDEYGDTVKSKKVLFKGKKKSRIPRHTTNIINVRQRIKQSANGSSCASWKSDKMWVVRGHWRNQYYSKTDTYKHKWIDPYFKGEGNDVAKKVYKL
jgi:hypothetical protein